MSPAKFRNALDTLRWSQRGLAAALACDDRLVRRWASGDSAIPDDVALWLGTLAVFHQSHPPPDTWRTRRTSTPGTPKP